MGVVVVIMFILAGTSNNRRVSKSRDVPNIKSTSSVLCDMFVISLVVMVVYITMD